MEEAIRTEVCMFFWQFSKHTAAKILVMILGTALLMELAFPEISERFPGRERIMEAELENAVEGKIKVGNPGGKTKSPEEIVLKKLLLEDAPVSDMLFAEKDMADKTLVLPNVSDGDLWETIQQDVSAAAEGDGAEPDTFYQSESVNLPEGFKEAVDSVELENPSGANVVVDPTVPDTPSGGEVAVDPTVPDIPSGGGAAGDSTVPENSSGGEAAVDPIVPETPSEGEAVDSTAPENSSGGEAAVDPIVPEIPSGGEVVVDPIVPETPSGDGAAMDPIISENPSGSDIVVEPAVPDAGEGENNGEPVSCFLLDEVGMLYGFLPEYAEIPDGCLTLPAECTGIRQGAFSGCGAGIFELYIPAGVTMIEEGALSDLVSLEWIDVEEGNCAYASDNGVLFDSTISVLMAFPVGWLDIYMVPPYVTRIADRAFDGTSIYKLDLRGCETLSFGENVFGSFGGSGIQVAVREPEMEMYAGMLAGYAVTLTK